MKAVVYEDAVRELKEAFPEFYEEFRYKGVGYNFWEPPEPHAAYLRFAEYSKDALKFGMAALLQRSLNLMERLALSRDRWVLDLVGEFLAEFDEEQLNALEQIARPNLVQAIRRQYERWE